MKKLVFFILGLFLFAVNLVLQSCSGCNRPEPNWEGVLMQNCGKNGLEDFTTVTGSQGVLGPCTELYQVPRFEQRADPTEYGITSKDGGYFKVDPMYVYNMIPGKGPEVIYNYKHAGVQDQNSMMDNIEEAVLNPIVLNAYREEARTFTTDSLLNNLATFETRVEDRLTKEFEKKFFILVQLSSGLKPPQTMIEAIERRNNAVQEAEQVKNELEVARMRLEKDRIEAEANKLKSQGLTKEVGQKEWIDAIRYGKNQKVIITDGKTPVLINQ